MALSCSAEGLLVVAIHGHRGVGVFGNVVGTERYQGLEIGQKFPRETVHTMTVEKLGAMANVLSNVHVWKASCMF